MGDFNSHSQSWGYDHIDAPGEEIEAWQDDNNLTLIDQPYDTPTFYARCWHTTSTPDIVLYREDLHSITMREVGDQLGGSDHRPAYLAPNDTAYKRWSCHSGLKLLCKLCRTSPPPAMETNPGPTTLNKKVWICDICHKQIHVRKQISIRCNRIEHWVHLRCAGIRQAQYTDTWTCHLHR